MRRNSNYFDYDLHSIHDEGLLHSDFARQRQEYDRDSLVAVNEADLQAVYDENRLERESLATMNPEPRLLTLLLQYPNFNLYRYPGMKKGVNFSAWKKDLSAPKKKRKIQR